MKIVPSENVFCVPGLLMLSGYVIECSFFGMSQG
jgi:hypothetical protein